MDDDIVLTTAQINELFVLRETRDLDILQPSYCGQHSLISHKITKQIPGAILHYTNFIEVTAPLFSKEALHKCMTIYDLQLYGYGIDLLFMWHLGTDKRDKYAVIDQIPCINPPTRPRKIDQLQPLPIRRKIWFGIQKRLGTNPWRFIPL